MRRWRVVFTRQAVRDSRKLASSNLRPKVEYLLRLLEQDPLQSPPPFEKLAGDLAGSWSRRINIQHRIVYQVLVEEKTVKVLRFWTRYE